MKTLLGLFGCLAFSAAAWGQQTVTEWKWNEVARTGLPPGAALVSLDGRTALKIENPRNTPLQLTLLSVEKPKITAHVYAVHGEVRYDGVRGNGYLEMWNLFPPGKPGATEGQFVTRTLAESGESGLFRGTSNWRPFSLPFNTTGASAAPDRLQINLVLPGRGTVYLGAVWLVQYVDAQAYVPRNLGDVWFYGRTAHPWWTNRTSGWLGLSSGVIIACLGGVIGVLCAKGQGRGLVLALLKIEIGVGVVLALLTLAAVANHQPYAVWYPLLLTAIFLLVVCPLLLPAVAKGCRQKE